MYQVFEENGKMSNMMTASLSFEEENKIISTKANTLKALSDRLKLSMIEDMLIITVKDFLQDQNKVFNLIEEKFLDQKIVVRSSSTNEDSFKKSNAGHFTSVLDVDSGDYAQVTKAITSVMESYKRDYEDELIAAEDIVDEQILIQHQAVDVVFSGVLFTYDIQGRRPYYLINYDDKGSTNSVTSGIGGKTLWIERNAKEDELPLAWKNLINSVRELELLLNNIPLDIEFAINKNNQVIIFQARPLVAVSDEKKRTDDGVFFEKIEKITRQYDSYRNIFDGQKMTFSDMAFWNPSEIIGTSPKNLDYSLYREIITHRSWNAGLIKLGYRKVEDDLMFKIGNKPYISLDYSFYTLIPESVPEKLAKKITTYYEKKLEADITAHDKIEFEIAYSSFDFSTDKTIEDMLEQGFTQDEVEVLKSGLRHITTNAVLNHKDILRHDRNDIEELNRCREFIEEQNFEQFTFVELLNSILELLASINRLGTPQFARQARMAFMARSFCRTLQEQHWFEASQIDDFMKSIETVSSKFERDYQRFSRGKLSRKDFNKKYGHLRSGTYDIRTDRYDQMVFKPVPEKNKTSLRELQKGLDENIIEQALATVNLNIDTKTFNDFLSSAIEAREYFKFEFTKSLSLVLELIKTLGKILDIKRTDLSWLEVEDFKNAASILNEIELNNGKGKEAEVLNTIIYIKERWCKNINKRKEAYKEAKEVILPDVILGPQSLKVIPVNEARPNFITSKKVEGEVVLLEESGEQDLMDKIVVIPKADPGYEWIFTKGIKGFITKYGGVASHMAIRCAEFEIPAAIGCGQKIYEYVSKRPYIELDCANGVIGEGMQCQDLRALITQREGVNQYGDPTDVLEAAYVKFYESLGFVPQPASNHIKNVGKLFERKVDLLIVCGGGALPSKYYDKPHDEELQPHRDIMEEKLIRHCLAQGIPIICTCRGMQYMNVLFGGKLLYHPDLPEERPRGVDHEIYLVEENRSIWVNNFHRDVIPADGLADCFKPLAVDRQNGTIEAFGSDKMKVLALQWHPERRFETSNALQETRKLVIDFIQKHIQ